MKLRFSPFGAVCNLLTWVLRPLTAPLESMLHEAVGERYPGFASWVAVPLIVGWAALQGSPLLVLFAIGLVARLVVHRVRCVRSRLGGDPLISSRSPGRPLLARVAPEVNEGVLLWVEPVAVMVVGVIISIITSPLGHYLLLSGAALLVSTLVRAAGEYHRQLDVLDAGIESIDGPARPSLLPHFGHRPDAPAFGFPVNDVPRLAAVADAATAP